MSGTANLIQTGTGEATQQALVFTPTRTSFRLQAGPVDVNITFLSPIEVSISRHSQQSGIIVPQPKDLIKQSMPFTYIYMDLVSNDGQPHDVQVYSDISAGEVKRCLF